MAGPLTVTFWANACHFPGQLAVTSGPGTCHSTLATAAGGSATLADVARTRRAHLGATRHTQW